VARTLVDLSSYLRSASSLAREQQQVLHPALPVPGLAPLLTELPRGGIAEVSGPRSSGRMAILQHVLAQATRQGEICALLDTHDQFSPMRRLLPA
jgi:RecA/RadA recombinase